MIELKARKWYKQSEQPMPQMVWVRARWPADDAMLGYVEYMTFLDGRNGFYWIATVHPHGDPAMECMRLEQPVEWVL